MTPTPATKIDPALAAALPTIWRWKLTEPSGQTFDLPAGATFASWIPGNGLSLYFVVPNPQAATEKRAFGLVETGEPLPKGATFLATLAPRVHLVELPPHFVTA